MSAPRDGIAAAIRSSAAEGRPALVAYLTAGFPSRATFSANLEAVASASDVVEVGVPFSDPMADGTTIQRASFAALREGVTLPWVLEQVAAARRRIAPPILLMSYLNPLLQFGLEALPRASAAAGVAGYIVPDLPYEESADLKQALELEGLVLIQMVTPVTPAGRLEMLCRHARGFIYAVTMTGTTGKSASLPPEVLEYMGRIRKVSAVPVCAGFGIRSRDQVVRFKGHVDGVVVGSALVEVLERGGDARAFLSGLRSAP